mgnify:CR=1 FL=1
MKCEVCKLNEADLEDWRDFGYDSPTEHFQACKNCINLRDVPYLDILESQSLDETKDIIEGVIRKDWKDWVIKKDG